MTLPRTNRFVAWGLARRGGAGTEHDLVGTSFAPEAPTRDRRPNSPRAEAARVCADHRSAAEPPHDRWIRVGRSKWSRIATAASSGSGRWERERAAAPAPPHSSDARDRGA